MPDVTFWRDRFATLGIHSVGPGDTQTEAELEEHRQVFARAVRPWLETLKGPVLDFGCGVGRWVPDLPRPYVGLDLLPEHLDICRGRYGDLPGVEFCSFDDLRSLPVKAFSSIFTCTVLQHIVERDLRREILSQFRRLLADDGVLLSVEWAEGQRDYDWCRSVSKHDLKLFNALPVAQAVESGRRHSVWLCQKKKSFFRLW